MEVVVTIEIEDYEDNKGPALFQANIPERGA